jgi:hypothetical protein
MDRRPQPVRLEPQRNIDPRRYTVKLRPSVIKLSRRPKQSASAA